ncbi:MAG: TlpA family protein disulfide reductase [Deltaproteobacteria bacterium]|nr:TlpA family protein disulfide reductase [Deltaproteobacteria bacterium]
MRVPLLLAALSACPDEAPTRPARSRVDMVVRDAAAAAAVAPEAGRPPTPPAAPTRTGPLCEVPDEPRRIEPPPSQTVLGQGAEPPPPIAIGASRWTWLNLWAAWCVPCKEEMPLIATWKARLAADGFDVDLVFLSLDDDERQLRQLLDRATPGLPRATAWMPGGTPRTRWMKTLGLRENPALPVQVLVGPSGQHACTIRGALEPGDYDRLLAFLRSPPR